jgi:hypothetical protein
MNYSDLPAAARLLVGQTPSGDYAIVKVDASGSVVMAPQESGLAHLGYQQITDLSAAAALTVPVGATVAVIVAEGQDVRYRADMAPTATVGMPLTKGTQLRLSGAALLAAVKFFQQSATAKLNVDYYG